LFDVIVLKLDNISFREKCARRENTLKIPSPTKLSQLGHFPPANQAGRLAGPVFYVYVFSLVWLVIQNCILLRAFLKVPKFEIFLLLGLS
jgi:hypothetical protein